MPATRSGRSYSPRPGRGNNDIDPVLAGMDPTTPRPDSPLGTIDVSGGLMDASVQAQASGHGFTKVVDHIIQLCGFPPDSTMVRYIEQQGWTEIEHITTIGVQEVKDFFTTRDDGSFEARPMMIHLRMFKAFLLYYMRKSRDFSTTLMETDIYEITKTEFKDYCGSSDYHADAGNSGYSPGARPGARADVPSEVVDMGIGHITPMEFRRSVKRDKNHYGDLKDDKYFNTWNRGFVATAHMHHTHLVLDETYVPKTTMEIAVFQDMQTFMYAVLEEHLKTDTGKSLVSQYELTRDAQSIYRELKKHALNSTAAQLSGDTLLQYITTARFPGAWRGTAHSFVLHWKEQVAKYERLEVEDFPPKQKLRMLQNAVGDVTELAYVKQIGDQDIARGRPSLGYEGYMELLLSACSTYDKKTSLPGKQKRAVYASEYVQDYDIPFTPENSDGDYKVFNVDTDISDVLINYSNTNRFGNQVTKGGDKRKSNFLPRDEWNKLTQEQKDQLIAKRRQEQTPSQSFRQANVHEVGDMVNIDDIIEYITMNHTLSEQEDKGSNDEPSIGNALLAHMAGQSMDSNPGDVRQVLASNRKPIKNTNRKVNESTSVPSTVTVGDTTYYLNKGETITVNNHHYTAHMTCIPYRVSQHDVSVMEKALVDRGANGGICGDDMLVLEGSERFVDVFGLAGHKVSQLRIVTAQALITTHKGQVIATFHQMALLGKGKSILSCLQMEAYGADINDRPTTISGGKQRILIEDYQIPLDFKNGLAYLRCRIPNKEELQSLPHVIMTANVDWDPSQYDHTIDKIEEWYDPALEDIDHENPFDAYGDYRHRTIATHAVVTEEEFFDALECVPIDEQVDDLIDFIHPTIVANTYVAPIATLENRPDFELLRPFFGWAPADTIKRTFAVTTQHARGRVSDTLKQHWKSRFPACNVKRRNEPVATDTVFSDTPAVASGVTAAQIFVGRESLVVDVYPLKTDKEFVNTLEDNIRERGAMDKLISDGAKAETSQRVKQILRALVISDWFSEPYYQNQNFAENRYGTLKAATNRVLNLSGAPANLWLLALIYVSLLLNHLASAALGWKPPLQVLTGQTPDISPFLHFLFFEPVYYHAYGDNFPSASNEKQGWWVGVATHVGDFLTYKVLTQTNQIIYRSVLRSANDPAKRNKRLSPIAGEMTSNIIEDKTFVRSNFNPDGDRLDDSGPTVQRRMVTIDPKDLIGRTFLKDTEEDGQRFRARVVRAIVENKEELKACPDYLKFICEVPNSEIDEIFTYNEILDYIERDNNDIENDTEQLYKFRQITAHQGPLRSTDKDYKGSTYNVLVEWESGESTYEPLDLIAADDPVTCAEYATKHDLLDTPGWKRFKSYGKNAKKLERMINQAKLHSYRREPFWKFGVLVPRNHKQVLEIDEKNKNTLWQEAEATEMQQLLDYKTFIDNGKGTTAPTGYKRIRCHMIYDVKHDGRHKARLVAGGHLTDPNTESVYSGVVSLRGIRLVVFLAELNSLKLWGADVGNAYLEAATKEKVYIIGGPEFGPLEGHTLIIFKALYGLRSSGLCWYQRFSDVLRAIGFTQSKAEPEIWMREKNGIYEYIAVYVDDLLIAAKNPDTITAELVETHKFKLKGVGELTYHLGCNYF